MYMSELLLLVVFLPLLGFFILAFLGRFIGSKLSGLFASLLIAISLVFAIYTFKVLALTNTTYTISLTPWIQVGILNIQWAFLFDSLTFVMLSRCYINFLKSFIYIH